MKSEHSLQAYHQTRSSPCKSSISTTSQLLLLINDLKDVELEVITLVRCPQDRMIRALCLEFYLAETLMRTMRSLPDCFGKKLRIHEMGAGTSYQESAVLHQF